MEIWDLLSKILFKFIAYFTLLLSKIEINLVFGFASRAIFILIVSGTAKNIPPMPKTKPQNSKLKITTSVEIPSPLPRNLGSIKFPIAIFTTKYIKVSHKVALKSFTAKLTKIAGTAAIIDPIVGI